MRSAKSQLKHEWADVTNLEGGSKQLNGLGLLRQKGHDKNRRTPSAQAPTPKSPGPVGKPRANRANQTKIEKMVF